MGHGVLTRLLPVVKAALEIPEFMPHLTSLHHRRLQRGTVTYNQDYSRRDLGQLLKVWPEVPEL